MGLCVGKSPEEEPSGEWRGPLSASPSARESLARFLHSHRDRAIAEWEETIRAIPAAIMLDPAELRDHMPSLIDRVLELVERQKTTPRVGGLAEKHAIVRMQEGFNLEQVAWEYSALRSTLLRLNDEQKGLESGAIVLLNDAIDEAVVHAVSRFHRARVRMLEALDSIAMQGLLAEPKPLDALLRRLLQVIMDTVEAVDTAVLFLREWDRLVLRAATGLEADIEGKFSLAMGEGFAGAVAAERRPLITHSAGSDPRVRNEVLRMSGVKALYGVPLVYGNEVIGVAKMGSRTVSDFAADDRLILRSAAQRAAAFIAQRSEADDRELLLHVLGHDIRSPLNTIVLSASVARHRPELPPVVGQTFDRVVSAARRIDRLVSDLTDYTETRAAGRLALRREMVDLREVVVPLARDLASSSGCDLRLDLSGDVTGHWDRGRVERVVVNLVNNALAYGAPATAVTVGVEGDDDAAAVTLRVHNEGSPIPADLVPYLFDAFKRGTKGTGSGLGLFIVQQIVRSHGGTVQVESSAERGTTFTVRLPRAA